MNVANCIEEILKLHPYRYMVFSMMYPIMVKIDFGEVVKAGKSGKPVFLTLVIVWIAVPLLIKTVLNFCLGYCLA